MFYLKFIKVLHCKSSWQTETSISYVYRQVTFTKHVFLWHDILSLMDAIIPLFQLLKHITELLNRLVSQKPQLLVRPECRSLAHLHIFRKMLFLSIRHVKPHIINTNGSTPKRIMHPVLGETEINFGEGGKLWRRRLFFLIRLVYLSGGLIRLIAEDTPQTLFF